MSEPCGWCDGTGETYTGYDEGNPHDVPVMITCVVCYGSGIEPEREKDERTQ